MSESTPNLRLPYILSAQAQKHVTHNEAIRALDALVQISVVTRALAAPPTTAEDGARYIVAAGASGAWSGKAQAIACMQDGAWAFREPREGWIAWIADEDRICAFDGESWALASASTNPTPLVGVNATADETNRLSVSSPASLLNHAGAGHQQKINKAAAGDTASTLYQTGFSGRAEVGLAGDDNLHVKVSADGSAWKEAIVVDRGSGIVSMPFTTNPWAGKKWTALGTSITSSELYTWPLAMLLGATLTNLGDAGASLAQNGSGGSEVIYEAIDDIAGDADLVTVEAGINDFGLGSTLGTIADTTTSTFYGALHAAAIDILADDVDRTLVFLVPYSISAGYSGPDWDTANANSNTLAQFQQAVRDVARKFGCPVIDLAESGISAQTASLYLSDGLHLTSAGGVRYAEFAFGKLRNILPKLTQVATPSFSPSPGSYEGAQSVTISCATSGARIHYTTDGSLPTLSSPVYSSAISVPATATLKAVAIKSGLAFSALSTAAYTIVTQVATPSFSPPAGTYGSAQSVAISCATSGATIYYTTDGSTPTTSSSVYSGAISVPASATLKAIGVKSGLTNSAVGTAAYIIEEETFSPADLEPALWWDVSDLSTLFQDTGASSAVTTDGQSVARINDKSGNSRNVTQSTSGSRPAYKTDGTHHWLLLDGGDQLNLSSIYTTPDTSYAVAWAARQDASPSGKGIVLGSTAGPATTWAGSRVLSDSKQPETDLAGAGGIDGGFGSSSSESDHVVVINVNAGAYTIYQNGTAGATGSVSPSNFSAMGIGFEVGTYLFKGRVYQAMMIPRTLTSGEVADLTDWLKAKAGVA